MLPGYHPYQVGSGDLKRWKSCIAAMEKTGAKWGDETTVGAGTPLCSHG